MTRIFASGVFGSDYDLWGAWSFTDEKTRDKLARIIADDDWCLAIGMQSPHTPVHERGRLIALLKVGPQRIQTQSLVEPEHWRETIEKFGRGKWEFAFPIKCAERFVAGPGGLPLRRDILPRIDAENRYMQVGRYFMELDSEEVQRVLALPRTADDKIFRTPISTFVTRLLKHWKGPPPTAGKRVLSAESGPAATYLAKLTGSALEPVVTPLRIGPAEDIWKLGFSKNPEQRVASFNAFLPCDPSLQWRLIRTQWHEDEINAWAMEQRMFELVTERGLNRFKGEMLATSEELIDALWTDARVSATRPERPVEVDTVA